jgi:hypothetical protein
MGFVRRSHRECESNAPPARMTAKIRIDAVRPSGAASRLFVDSPALVWVMG